MTEVRTVPQPGGELSLSSPEVPVAGAPPEFRAMQRCGRLGVELQIVGLLALGSMLVTIHAAAWAVLSHAEGAITVAAVVRIAVPQYLAVSAVAMRALLDLPAARWDRTGRFVHRRLPWAFVLAGWLLAPIAVILWRRDRGARRIEPSAEALVGAHTRLVRAPYWTAVRFLAWTSIGFMASAMWLAAGRATSAELDVTVGLVWIGAVAPVAVALAGALRVAVRPEVITVPTPVPPRRVYDLAVRVQLLTACAGIGAVVTIAAGGTLLAQVERERDVTQGAERRAQAVLDLVGAGDEVALGQALGRNPDVTIDVGGRRLGPTRGLGRVDPGPVDLDEDGTPDAVVARRGTAQIIVPMGHTAPIRTAPLALVGVLAIVATIVGGISIARDVQRDVVLALSQVGAVAQGRAPPALATGALSTSEIRRFVQSVDRLVARITESNVEKYVAIEKSKEADRLKSQFLANMSHDLRSPLNSVLGFSELLLSGIDGPLTEEQREMVAVINTSGGELLQQIDDILDAAKLDAGRLELHPEPSPPLSLINRAITNAQRRVGSDVAFDVISAGTLPPAFVDPYRTVQALENVLAFAAVRLERGVITVRAELAASGRRRMIVVEVRTPVAPASAAQLATARRGFHRLPGHRGLGLSLPIAGAILELQGGTLSIREASNRAMAFRIELRALEMRRTSEPPRARGSTRGA